MLINLKDYVIPSTCLIVSKRNTGKTVQAKYILYNLVRYKKINNVIVFSDTSEFSNDFDCVDKKYVLNFSEEKFNEIVNKKKEEIKKKGKQNSSETLILLDDITNNKSLEVINTMYKTSRHINISIIHLCQYPKYFITPTVRNNIDYMLWNTINYSTSQILYENTVGFENVKEFIKITNENNNEYKFLVYDNICRDTNRLSIMKAKDIKFKITDKKK